MSAQFSTTPSLSEKTLIIGTRLWLSCLILAQIIFITYLMLGYGLASIENRIEDWNKFNNTAYVSNDTLGNFFYGLHVLLAIVMIAGGSLQLIPSIRNRFISFHRLNGRLYLSLACVISIAGMYLILVRGTVGDLFLHSMTFFSGLVVLSSSFFAIKAIRGKDIKRHQTWAIRLFLAANGVLFFRLFIFGWFLLFGPLGVNTSDFTGPTVYAVSICSYVLPLLIFEWYRYAIRNNSRKSKVSLGLVLSLISLIFLTGLIGITMGNWYPSLFEE
uniref:DUF2306 domain-containing protein n=1 Tax=Ningiella ruwaisensis TaxID=2364274 RepID=UPI00109F60EA|nr:DUF2306 domain-containing protein [Ningiella ruwaisensis]